MKNQWVHGVLVAIFAAVFSLTSGDVSAIGGAPAGGTPAQKPQFVLTKKQIKILGEIGRSDLVAAFKAAKKLDAKGRIFKQIQQLVNAELKKRALKRTCDKLKVKLAQLKAELGRQSDAKKKAALQKKYDKLKKQFAKKSC